jgi:hypothetical protein
VTSYGPDLREAGVRVPVVSRPAQGHTQTPVLWVPGAPSTGVKRPRRDAVHPPQATVEFKKT